MASVTSRVPVTLWSIMSKVRLEAMMWGAGTALGELPPYFMARAARMSTLGGGRGRRGRRRSSLEVNDDVEKLAEFEALKLKQQHPEQMVWLRHFFCLVSFIHPVVNFLLKRFLAGPL